MPGVLLNHYFIRRTRGDIWSSHHHPKTLSSPETLPEMTFLKQLSRSRKWLRRRCGSGRAGIHFFGTQGLLYYGVNICVFCSWNGYHADMPEVGSWSRRDSVFVFTFHNLDWICCSQQRRAVDVPGSSVLGCWMSRWKGRWHTLLRIHMALHQKLVWDHAEDFLCYLSFIFPVHGGPSVVSVITVMYITGRNEFKCFVRLFESWFPICASACCVCVLSHVVASRWTQSSADLSGLWDDVTRRSRLFLLSILASIVITGRHFLILWCSIKCVFLMWND